jgi:hypothetical protein
MAAGDLTTLAAAEAWVGIGSDNGGPNDTMIASLITSASTWIGNELQRHVLSAEYTHTFTGNGQRFMLLRQAPVTAISALTWGGTTIPAANLTTLAAGYWIDDDGRTLHLLDYRFPYRMPLQVSYTAGYATPPADIAQACNELVGSAFKRKTRIDEMTRSLGGQETASFSQADMGKPTRAALDKYKFMAPV